MRLDHADLPLVELKSNYRTLIHIARVRDLLNYAVTQLLQRGERHDATKLQSPERECFAAAVPLNQLPYGSPAYAESRERLAPALAHHYKHSRHHPEHFRNGIRGMDLVDLFEMFLDWKAASEMSPGGDIMISIRENTDRFGLPPELVSIFENTAAAFAGA